ncbi:DUF7507 domain-containing protein [Leifsonia sp. 2MCAF36]|uniref:DUF7507 domain-containing protein n=1 Tax=Leifsonia sp. 2MCAF36 TaxID=3232988 RepID=UPI003F9B0189
MSTATLLVSGGPAVAGAGSVVSGVAWADTNLDQVHEAGESAVANAAVALLSSPAGTVIATTTSNAQGQYSFVNEPDASYVVRVTAPAPFTVPASRSGDNDFASAGTPAPGQPQLGDSLPFAIAGATQQTGLDAGLQPLATIQVAPLTQANACQNLIVTGSAPFDATDGGGMDSGPANCLVRTADVTSQNFGVSLTGLPTGASVSNVVLDVTASSVNGARFAFSGPGTGGLPTGCLTAGVTPPSSIQNNPDGSVVLHCNMGTFTSAVAPITISLTPNGTSLNNSTFHVTASAHASGGDAISSNTVTNPDVQVTGVPVWDVSKADFGSTTTPTTVTLNGQQQVGYVLAYLIVFRPLNAKGETLLANPLTFTDRLSLPGALMFNCNTSQNGGGTGLGLTPGAISCPAPGTPAGNGITATVTGMAMQTSGYHVRFFIPLDDAYRMIDPTWQPGDPVPTGSITPTNAVIDTQNYQDASGQLNYGTSATPGFEPGWNGTTASGNNLITAPTLQVRPPTPGIPGSGKSYYSLLGGCCSPQAAAGNVTGSSVVLHTDAQTTITNPVLVDAFDVSLWRIETLPTPPAGYLVEYAVGPNTTNLQTGPPVNASYPYDSTDLVGAATTGNQTPGPYGPWSTDPTSFGANWRDTVNMVRLRPIDPATFLSTNSTLNLNFTLRARGVYNGGPNAGQSIPKGVAALNEGGWTDPTNAARWSTNEAVLRFQPLLLAITKTVAQTEYLPGDAVPWTLSPQITAGSPGQTVPQVVVTDTLPTNLELDAPCTQASLPSGVALSYNPVNRVATFSYGDLTIPGSGLPFTLTPFTVCTTVSTLAVPGSTLKNNVAISAPIAPTATGSASITVNGTGKLALQKSVDRPLVAPGQAFTWQLDWSNTSTNIPFAAPDLIDVFPWNGDAAAGSLSKRDQYASDFTGTTGIAAALAPPTYTSGLTGDVPGTWYYATAASSTIPQDARNPINTAPEAPGGLWLTAAEIAGGPGFGAVTAVRFVAATQLDAGQAVRALTPSSATPATVGGSPQLNGLYVDRAEIFSATFPDQPLPSNEPYVLMPGWSLGDLVWIDRHVNGVFDSGDLAAAGVPVEVLDAGGVVVASTVTNSDGRWIVQGLHEGTYTVRIPAAAFQTGGPLAGLQALTLGATNDLAVGESIGNKNNPSGTPAVAGLSSIPITLAYTTAADGSITGGNQPTSAASDPGQLLNPFLPAGFMNTNLDLTATPTPALTIQKSADVTRVTRPGQVVTYTFLVSNTGGLGLTGVNVTDTPVSPAGSLDAAPVCGVTVLAPGESTTCTATYTTTQADVDVGSLADSAVAGGTPPGGLPDTQSPPDALVIPVDAPAAITIAKSTATATVTAVGQQIPYDFTVTNSGGVTLTGVSVADTVTRPSDPTGLGPISCAATTLAPAASTTCTATYTTTQADLDAGSVNDSATATGSPPTGPAVVSAPSVVSVPVAVPASIALVKSSSTTTITTAGQGVPYTFLVTNTGGLTLTGVRIADTLAPPSDPARLGPLTCADTVLAPAASTTCTATYTTIQADVDAGMAADSAVAFGTPGGGLAEVSSPPSIVSIPVVAAPSIALVKATTTGSVTQAGQSVPYTFTVTNTGALTLTSVSVVDTVTPPSDPANLSAVVCPATTTLAPGASTTCTATYTTTQADMDAPSVIDTAAATATAPDGTAVHSPDATVTIPTVATPGLTVVKAAPAFDGASFVPGGTIPYRVTVTNAGNVTLTAVQVTDVGFTGSGTLPPITCPATVLAPAASMVCTTDYLVTQADVDAGSVSNSATATADPPSGAPVAGTSTPLVLPAPPIPSLSLTKTASPTQVGALGDTIDYTYGVTNTGNATLTGVAITETHFTGTGTLAAPTCPTGPLAPGAQVTCTATYHVTAADLASQRIDNTAVATAYDPAGRPVSSPSADASVAVTVPSTTGHGEPTAAGLAGTGGDARDGLLPLGALLIGLGAASLIRKLRRSGRTRRA